MSYNKLKVTEEEAIKILKRIRHQIYQEGFEKYWKTNDKKADFQSMCWLFVWASTTRRGCEEARESSKIAFNKIFHTSYSRFDTLIGQDTARNYNRRQTEFTPQIGKIVERRFENNCI